MTENTPRSFDHTPLAELAEYHAAREAVDDLIKAARRIDSPITIDDLLDMARTVYAADNCDCPSCRVEDTLSDDRLDLRCWPFRASVEGKNMLGTYRCPRTGRTWTCSYTTDPDLLGRMP